MKTLTRSDPPTTSHALRYGRPPTAAKAMAAAASLSKTQEARIHRRAAEIKMGQEALASELARSLVLLHYKGNCRCGLMLTERDKNPNAETYRCPHCGRSGPLASVTAASQKQG